MLRFIFMTLPRARLEDSRLVNFASKSLSISLEPCAACGAFAGAILLVWVNFVSGGTGLLSFAILTPSLGLSESGVSLDGVAGSSFSLVVSVLSGLLRLRPSVCTNVSKICWKLCRSSFL